jgi:cell division protein FtsB
MGRIHADGVTLGIIELSTEVIQLRMANEAYAKAYAKLEDENAWLRKELEKLHDSM